MGTDAGVEMSQPIQKHTLGQSQWQTDAGAEESVSVITIHQGSYEGRQMQVLR